MKKFSKEWEESLRSVERLGERTFPFLTKDNVKHYLAEEVGDNQQIPLFSFPSFSEVKNIAIFEKEIKNLLAAMNDMAENPDWDESDAQELMIDGGNLYKKYYGKQE